MVISRRRLRPRLRRTRSPRTRLTRLRRKRRPTRSKLSLVKRRPKRRPTRSKLSLVKRRPKRRIIRKYPRRIYVTRRPRSVYILNSEPASTILTSSRSLAGTYSTSVTSRLRQTGLDAGVWRTRLRSASLLIRNFIKRFYRVAGFEHVIQAYYANSHIRQIAKLAVKAAKRFAKNSNYRQVMSFAPTTQFAPDGQTVTAIKLIYKQRTYRFLSWTTLNESALRRQLARDVLLHKNPDQIRWVFDRNRINMTKTQLIQEIKALAQNGTSTQGWLNQLDKVVLVI